MKPPIIAYEHGDVLFFESVLDAERYLEPIDVANHVYTAYDSEGRLLRLDVKREKRFASIAIQDAEPVPTHSAELKKHLCDFFTHVGADKDWLETASLEQLIAQGLQEYQTI